jgi:outer membrane protein OmpA-like peptidoglycan-associated protein
MTYLVTHFWAWWMAALAIGAATAFLLPRRPERGALAGWLAWFGLAFVVGLPVALLHLLAGRAGLWLETGFALFAGFLAGAALGALAGGRSLREHEGWAVGLLPLALIWVGAGVLGGRSLEADLKRQASAVVEKLGGDAAQIEVEGRDVRLPRDASRAEAERRIAQIAGVRRIVESDASEAKRLAADDVAAHADLAPTAVPAAPAEPTPAAPKEAPLPPARAELEQSAASKPESDSRGAEPTARAGELDAAACHKAVAATLAEEPIRFARSGAGIRRVSSGALEKVTGLLKRCPTAAVEVRGLGDAADPGERSLARARAERVADYLWRMGVDRGRLVAEGRPAAGAEPGVELIVGPRH